MTITPFIPVAGPTVVDVTRPAYWTLVQPPGADCVAMRPRWY
jgi:hypothetical protein